MFGNFWAISIKHSFLVKTAVCAFWVVFKKFLGYFSFLHLVTLKRRGNNNYCNVKQIECNVEEGHQRTFFAPQKTISFLLSSESLTKSGCHEQILVQGSYAMLVEIKHCHWLKQVTKLGTSNQRVSFQHSIGSYAKILLMASAPGQKHRS